MTWNVASKKWPKNSKNPAGKFTRRWGEMILEVLAAKLPDIIENTITAGLKDHFKAKEEVVRQILLAELKLGRISLENIAKDDAFIGGYYRIVDAALKGVINRNLRLMCRILRNTLEQKIAVDETNTVLSIVAELSEEEVKLLAILWKCQQGAMQDTSLPVTTRIRGELVPNTYSQEHLDALLARLLRTGLVIAKSGYGGIIIEPSPLLKKFAELAELQIHNNA